MGVWGATPETKQCFLVLSVSNTPIPGIQKHIFWPMVYGGACVRSASPKPPVTFCIAHSKHTHPRYQKILFLAYGVRRCVCTERHRKTPRYFFALHVPNTPIPGIQNHLFWPMVCRGMGVWGATAEPHDIFWHCPFQTPPSHVSKNTFSGPWCAEVWVFGRN